MIHKNLRLECSAEELSVAIDNTETPFGRLPWTEPRCPYMSDHKCCFQPLEVCTPGACFSRSQLRCDW
jgi:hypothetical protein